jgi:squalene synthase HpnC
MDCQRDVDNHAVGIDHYENFPVASVLCPPALRPPIRALYAFARTADDLADEGDASRAERLASLAAFGEDLERIHRGEPPSPRWSRVFTDLAQAKQAWHLPVEPMRALLSAFGQDVVRDRYAERAEVLDYCARSANPVGRLLLHLYRLDEPGALARSDDICSGLQLANFWQDLGVDASRGRVYLPAADCQRHGFSPDDLVEARRAGARPPSDALLRASAAAVLEACDWAAGLLHRGAPLVHQVPGRAGWELRAVVQGGLRIVEKVRRLDGRTLVARPTIGPADAIPLAWRVLRMRRPAPSEAVAA